jgi:hypothetical protein
LPEILKLQDEKPHQEGYRACLTSLPLTGVSSLNAYLLSSFPICQAALAYLFALALINPLTQVIKTLDFEQF